MNTRTKWLVAAVVASALGLGLGQAWADPNPANDKDSLTVRITPNVDLGVDVDTTTTRLNYADAPGTLALTLDLNTTAYLISPATVTVLGNFGNQEVQLSAAGLNTWSVDTDETIGQDSVQVYALFAVNKASRPVEAEFGQGADGRHMVMFGGANKVAGEPVGLEANAVTNNKFEIANGQMTSGADMDGLAIGAVRQLWLRFDTPSATTVDTAQDIQVTLTAVSGVTN